MRVSSRAALGVVVSAAMSAAPAQQSSGVPEDPFPPLADYQVRSYSAADGLTSTTLTSLAQTPDGFLYVGTGRGLFRFDSRQFEPVALPGFATTIIDRLAVDKRGRLWLRSYAGDFAYIENENVHVLGRIGTTTDEFTSTSDGTIWMSGQQGLVRITAGNRDWFTVFTHADGLPSDTVAGVYETQTGELIVPTSAGLSRLTRDPRAKGGLRFDKVWSIPNSVVSSGYVRNDAKGLWVGYPDARRIILYHDGIVENVGEHGLSIDDFSWRAEDNKALAGNFGGLLSDADRWARTALIEPGRKIGHALRQADGTLWMDLPPRPTRSELFRLRPSAKLERISLGDRPEWTSITGLLEDHEGSIWIATDRGLLQLVKRRVRTVAQQEGLPFESVYPVLQTRDGSVWAGTWGNGLFHFAHGALAERLTLAHGLPDDRIRALFESSDGAFWVGMRNVAARLSSGRVVERIAVRNEVRAFAETDDHSLWIAGAQEIVVRRPDGKINRLSTVSTVGAAWSMIAEPGGSLLVGSQRGLFRVGPELTAPTRVAAGQGLDDAIITGIVAGEDGAVWIGTYEQGVFRLRANRVDHVDVSAGLPASAFFLLDDGKGGVWLTGNNGLWRVSKDSLRMVTDDIADGRPRRLTLHPVPFGESDGAAGPEGNRAFPAAWRLRDGRLVFNAGRGLNVVDPVDTSTSRISPRTIVLSVSADGQRVTTNADRAILPAQTRRVEIDFATLSFIAPHQHRFRYRLDGFDPEWTEVGAQARTAYTHLHPGRYAFHVRSVRPPGTTWLESEATEVIEVEASWWQTRWFQLAAVIALCGLAYAMHRLSLRQALAVHRVRATIASDLHDDLGSSINSIALMTQLLETDAELGGPERDLLARIQRAAEETALSVRQLVWLVDPSHADLEFLLLRLRRVANDLLPATDVEFDIAPSTRVRPLSMTVTRNVLLVFKEAVNNVARHAKATRVEIRVVAQRDALTVTIRDNGAGFNANEFGGGNGIHNMRRRAQELGGNLLIDAEAGRGATVLLTVKLP
ncbi:MAG TPA: two-component regulator propeller domain-containing protein [Gemmatimonadaceae bacterium]